MSKIMSNLNPYQKKLLEVIRDNYPNIFQRINEMYEDSGDLDYYNISQVKDKESLMECFDYAITDDLQEEFTFNSNQKNIYEHMQAIQTITKDYFKVYEELEKFQVKDQNKSH